MALKKGDFVELEYTGRIKDTGQAFDTTDKQVAESEGFADENQAYGPVIICLGSNQLLAGLNKKLIGVEPEKEYDFELSQEEAFGKKDVKLLKLISTAKFRKQGMNPVPGMRVNIDGMVGTIKTITGGRTIVDFNHLLAGRDLNYKVKIKRIVTNAEEKLKGMLKIELYENSADVKLTGDKAIVNLKADIPAEILAEFAKKAKELIPELKQIEFKK